MHQGIIQYPGCRGYSRIALMVIWGRRKGGVVGKRKPPGGASGARKIRLCRWIRNDDISFRRFPSIYVRFVSDPRRASQKFRPLYRPIPGNLYMEIIFQSTHGSHPWFRVSRPYRFSNRQIPWGHLSCFPGPIAADRNHCSI